MNKRIMIFGVCGITLVVGLLVLFGLNSPKDLETAETKSLEAKVLSTGDNVVMLEDNDNVIYTFDATNMNNCTSGNVVLEYTGLLDKDLTVQNVDVVNCKTVSVIKTDKIVDLEDDGIFGKYYNLAYNQVKKMTIDEKINQILLVRYPDTNGIEILKNKQFGGYLFFAKDFKGKTRDEVINLMKSLQDVANIPILTAVDEEGGVVVRISSNPNLASEKFKAPSTLYKEGGFDRIKEDTVTKSKLLNDLGLNLNLAPVVDVADNSSAYMYNRTLQKDTALTSEYAKTVIEASKGLGVSYTLKHFPGYGNNDDTHVGNSIDNRTYDEIFSHDIPPFETGIKAGAEAVLVSHNTVSGIDPDNVASLSPKMHNLLRDQLNFTGVIITDDLDMGAITGTSDAAVKAIIAGNDLLITTNYENDIRDIKNAINNGTLSEDAIEKRAMRVIAWKYYKGLLFGNQK